MRKIFLLKDKSGVSLLEVLVSLLILGFGLLGLAPMIVMSIEGNVISRDHSDVSRLAKEKIEYYEGLDSLPSMPFIEQEKQFTVLSIREINSEAFQLGIGKYATVGFFGQ